MGTILLIILILLLLGVLPTWPYSAGWGYGPSGILGIVLIIFIVLLLMGRIWPLAFIAPHCLIPNARNNLINSNDLMALFCQSFLTYIQRDEFRNDWQNLAHFIMRIDEVIAGVWYNNLNFEFICLKIKHLLGTFVVFAFENIHKIFAANKTGKFSLRSAWIFK